MRVIICDSAEAAGIAAADRVLSRYRKGDLRVLGVATGSSPLALYGALIDSEPAGFDPLELFALDEYVGLRPTDEQSYTYVVRESIAGPLRVRPERVHVPDGDMAKVSIAGAEYERLIRDAGGIDVQILGIGANGHIGFNEPGSSLTSRTRVKTLAAETRRDNARFFATPEDVPALCITQGLGTILDARQLVLVATGAAKARAVADAVEGPLSASCPASVLQLHPDATVVLDEAAAQKLVFADYYRRAQALENRMRAEGYSA